MGNTGMERLTQTMPEEPKPYPTQQPAQHQDTEPGIEAEMTPAPIYDNPDRKGSGKLDGKIALVSGGDSGIGRAVAVAFAKEGADVAIAFYDEQNDADETARLVQNYGKKCLTIAGDLSVEANCQAAVQKTMDEYGALDILVNNAAWQMPQESLTDITEEQLTRTFRTNVFSYFFLTKAALPHLKEGANIINTCSVTAFKGTAMLLDYSATKGAIVSFTRSLSQGLVEKKIRVNSVAPGPVWTPLIPATLPPDMVASFGSDVPMKRVGQPEEIASCYVFLASADGSYITGQTLHPNGGEVVNG